MSQIRNRIEALQRKYAKETAVHRLNTFMALHLYLERCRNEGDIPDSLGIMSRLLPHIPFPRLREMLRWDTPAPARKPSPIS